MPDIATRISQLIQVSKENKSKFAKRINVSQPFVSQLTSGVSVPSERTIRDICREYNVNYLWLTEGKGDMFTTTPESVVDELAEDFKLDEMDKKIIEKYLELSDERGAVIKQYLKSIFE